MLQPKYLGDGVYVSFDGYHINLAVEDHRNNVIALEPEVMVALIAYFEETKKLSETLECTLSKDELIAALQEEPKNPYVTMLQNLADNT